MLFKQAIPKLLLCAVVVTTSFSAVSARPHLFFKNVALEASALALITGSVAFCFKEKYDAEKHGEHPNASFAEIKNKLVTAIKNRDAKAFMTIINEYGIGREDDKNSLGAFIHSLWKKMQGPILLVGVLAALGKANLESACKEGRFSGLASFFAQEHTNQA